jgi:hypothetical protein
MTTPIPSPPTADGYAALPGELAELAREFPMMSVIQLRIEVERESRRLNWEQTGVSPDVHVAAAAALRRAHALALDRLSTMAPDPVSRAELEGVSIKLQTIEEAESGSAARLSNSELSGAYAPETIAGTTVSIVEKDGGLVRRVDNGLPDRALVYLKGNRYGLEGLPDGFVISFRLNHGKVELLLEEPSRT